MAKHGDQSARQHERRDAEVDHARDRRDGVVGVNGAEDEVPGLGGLAGDLGGLLVADFADENHVGVLPQDAAQLGGEGLARFEVHFDLRDAVHAVFDRVLDGDDVLLIAIDFIQARIQGRAFA